MNFVSEGLSKSCLENSNFVKIWQEFRTLDMKTFSHLWQYLDEFCLEWENFQTKVVEKKHILCLIIYFFLKIHPLWDGMGKETHGTAGETTGGNITWRMRFACLITGNTHTFRIYNTYCFSTSPVVTRTSLSVTLCALCLSCYLSFFYRTRNTPLLRNHVVMCVCVYTNRTGWTIRN